MDPFIALELLVVAAVLTLGDFDLGWVSSEGVAKPILILTSVLFPVFIVLGSVESTRLHEVILVTSALFLAFFSGLFVTLYPIY